MEAAPSETPTSRLYWITGLAGAGKSTIAGNLISIFRERGEAAILLDGDQIREALDMTDRHSRDDRMWLAWTYARLGRLIVSQGVHAICATISPFEEVRAWLRNNVAGYCEVYVRTSEQTLRSRDKKQLYSRLAKGEVRDVVGHDIPYAAPRNPDVVIDNEPGTSPFQHALLLANWIRSVPILGMDSGLMNSVRQFEDCK